MLAVAVLPLASIARAALWYVDPAAPGLAPDGTSWNTAWTSFSALSGVSAGDTVYFSGGAHGSTQTYNFNGTWSPAIGTTGSPVTYQIGQDPAHNGTAIFNQTGSGSFLGVFSNGYFTISGDAGDGAMHVQFTNWGTILTGNSTACTEMRFLYLNFGNCGYTNINTFTFSNISTSKIEIGHCYAYTSNLATNAFSSGVFTGPGFGDSSIHDCTIYLPRTEDGLGADGLEWDGTGFDIYNNAFIGYGPTYNYTQHGDGWQGNGFDDSNIRIYNNVFQDLPDYGIFAGGQQAGCGFSHLYIYNNIIKLTDPALQAGNAAQGIVIWTLGGGPQTDIRVMNNLVVDYGLHASYYIQNPAPGNSNASTWTNCVVSDNISVNSGSGGSTGGYGLDPAIAAANNVVYTSIQAASKFASYTPLSTGNNFHLLAGDSDLIGRGDNFSSYFSIDHDGVARPAVGVWDIGPYQYLSGTPVPTLPRIEGSNGHRQPAQLAIPAGPPAK